MEEFARATPFWTLHRRAADPIGLATTYSRHDHEVVRLSRDSGRHRQDILTAEDKLPSGKTVMELCMYQIQLDTTLKNSLTAES